MRKGGHSMKKIVVTIAREYGSGGRLIGRRLAEEMGFAFYDRELITLAAAECGLDEKFVESLEDKKMSGFLYSAYMTYIDLPVPERVFIAQSNAIRAMAERGSCVIIGRCADYVLADMPDCVSIFIHASVETRVKIVRDEYHEGSGELAGFIRKMDKDRAAYYNFFTQRKWGRAQNYDICIDSGVGIPESVRVLRKFIEEFAEARK
jgi:cytidylate kinase